jgi:hypothetical protein
VNRIHAGAVTASQGRTAAGQCQVDSELGGPAETGPGAITGRLSSFEVRGPSAGSRTYNIDATLADAPAGRLPEEAK